jgi:DNA-binding CsgD family transcriptional regulator
MLELLSADESPASIARLLHRSILTVRNHVQHMLAALGVHSVHQAVALFLLYGDGLEPAADEAGGQATSSAVR